MDGCFGGVFGDLVFADLNSLSRVSFAGGGIGGSGFPDDWFDVIARNAAENEAQKRRLAREQEEIAALVAAGIL